MIEQPKTTNERRRRRIGLLLDTLAFPCQNELLFGVHEQCSRHELDLYCLSDGGIEKATRTDSLYDLVKAPAFDALIVLTGNMAHDESDIELQAFMARFGDIPIVSLSTAVPSVASVIIDNADSMRDLTGHLIEIHGKRRIGFVHVRTPEGDQRFEGYRTALLEHGLAFDANLVVIGEFTWNSGVDAVRVLLDERKARCDALVGANDWIALGAMHALQLRGRVVPGDVAIAGFDDVDNARFANPPLSSVRQSARELGAEAVHLLLDMLQTRAMPIVKRVPTKLLLRQSCGCGLNSIDPLVSNAKSHERLPTMARSELWTNAMRRVSPRSVSLLQDTWARDLALALESDLSNESGEKFLAGLALVVENVGEFDCVPDWHDVIQALRASCVPSLREDANQWSRAESIFERAQRLVAAVAERVQGQRRIERESVLHLLIEINRECRGLHEDHAVIRGLLAQLPRVQIPSFYVARERGVHDPDENCELLLAYDDMHGSRTFDDVLYWASDIIPIEMQQASRRSMIVKRCSFGDGTLGFCVAEVGPMYGLVYESVCEVLNSGLHNASLLRQIVEEVSRREQAERARLEGEMKLAQRIQCEILPKGRQVRGLEIATAMIPAAAVGGDYFDILPFDGGCWLGIGDVVGHGLDTGLIMLMIQSVVSATTLSLPNGSPPEVWTVVNAVLFDNIRDRLGRDEYATLSLLRYDSSGRVAFAGAHEDLIICRASNGLCETIPTRGVWAGIFADLGDASLDCGQLQLHPGDVLLLHTDGITEAMNERREMFGLQRLCDALAQARGLPAEAIKDHVMARVFEWSSVVADDRTLVVARYILEQPTAGR